MDQEYNFETMTIEELCELHDNVTLARDDLDAQAKVLREIVESKMKEDSELHGSWIVSKVKRMGWTEVKVEQAREFGAVKEAVDTTKLNKLYKAGAVLPFTPSVISYVMIKHAEEKAE